MYQFLQQHSTANKFYQPSLSISSPWVLRVSTFVFILPLWTSNLSKRRRILWYTHYDAMELLAGNSWMKNWVIIAKTDFCSLILQVLVRYVGLKLNLMWTTSKSIHQEFSQHTHLHICLKSLQITFRRWKLQIQFLVSIPWIYFWLWWNFNYFELLIFAFAKFVLLASSVLTVGKEELILKSSKLP